MTKAKDALHDVKKLEALAKMRSVLKAVVTPIVLDESLTKDQRQEKLFPFLKALSSILDYDGCCELWNGVMADIVEENNLRRH